MPQAQTKTFDEKLIISNKTLALWKTGDNEMFKILMNKLPNLSVLRQ